MVVRLDGCGCMTIAAAIATNVGNGIFPRKYEANARPQQDSQSSAL
jgi:hypothetical protein